MLLRTTTEHEDYKNVLLNNEQLHNKMKIIRSQKRQLGSYEIKYHTAVSMISATFMIME